MLILGIESSCDETAASVARDHTEILSNVVSSQVEEHKQYGGVVPEIASRRHCENMLPVVQKALDDAGVILAELDGIAVTAYPGLIGALLVGVNFAKGLALAAGKPLVPTHHLAGHIAANYIAHPELKPPYLCLVVSGGHSHLVEVLTYTKFRILGRTRDDAAGECFDKCARAMGYPYPGGIHLDKASKSGNPKAFSLPKPKIAENAYDFSFSGLKTAVVNLLHNAQQKGETICREDLAASVQATISEVLTEHTIRAAVEHGYSTIAFYIKSNNNRITKDDMFSLAEFVFICMEEIDELGASELNQIKAMTTQKVVNERMAYAHYKEHRAHIASLCGTTNNVQFLTDLTGNRRWLPFEISSIDNPYTHPVDYEGVYSQAYALWKGGMRYWFEDEEIKLVNLHNRNFEVPSMERELIQAYYRCPLPSEEGTFVSTTDILSRINSAVKHYLSPVKIGLVMKQAGFELTRSNGKRGYRVVELPRN